VPEARFVQAGAWLEEDAAAVLRARAGENVDLRGWVEQSDLEELYRRASVYVQASWHEGFGMAIAEAMLAGCVPVVRTAGSMPEVVGDAGVLIDSSEPEAIADGVRRALTLGEDGRRRARERIVEAFPLRARYDGIQGAVGRLLAP
jgi:glycosyltransferase involved in cell wall biosynthesis